ncbi:hypothetical protein HYZ99_00100 [Candidatus Peregrinibacteria bacterium]|nr:hypothetical protein [Candidatus Peregrinibacteria bacterium]
MLILESDVGIRVWKDPMVDIETTEFTTAAENLVTVSDADQLLAVAEDLCNRSRHLFYGINRVTRGQVSAMGAAFVQASDRFNALGGSGDDRAAQLMSHVRSRGEILQKQLE